MKVTYHATKRFIERVENKKLYSPAYVAKTREFLEEMFMSVVPGSYARPFSLPQYKGFKVVHRDNTVITIVPKKRK